MSNLVLLSENPSFIAVATGVSILLLFIGFVGFHLLKKVSRLETDVKKIKRLMVLMPSTSFRS